jgi:hypothetical protein
MQAVQRPGVKPVQAYQYPTPILNSNLHDPDAGDGAPRVSAHSSHRDLALDAIDAPPAELAHTNACDKMLPVPSSIPGCQAAFLGIQNMLIADVSGRSATICAPGIRPVPVLTRPVYPPSGIAPMIAGHVGLAHGGLTAPIERRDEASE